MDYFLSEEEYQEFVNNTCIINTRFSDKEIYSYNENTEELEPASSSSTFFDLSTIEIYSQADKESVIQLYKTYSGGFSNLKRDEEG